MEGAERYPPRSNAALAGCFAMTLSAYAAFAQKESESISGNMRWSYQRRMEAGTFLPPSAPYGYRIINKEIEIDPEQAVTIRKIFQWYLDGNSKERIARRLNEVGILSGQNKEWGRGAIHYILTNERYTGNSLWQKTYTSETLPTTRHRNKGECEQYYAEGTHPPIITTETFERVQNLIQARKQNYGKTPPEMTHLLSRKVVCGCCGTMFRRKPQRGKYYWCCIKHDENREKCHITPITEQSIYEAFCRLYYKLKHQSLPILEQMLETLQTIRDRRLLWSEDIVSLNKKISELSSQNQTLAFLKQNGLVDPDIFISKSNELTRQLRQAKLDKEKLMDAEGDTTAQRTRELIALLEDGPDFLDHPDTELCGALVAEIIVESNDSRLLPGLHQGGGSGKQLRGAKGILHRQNHVQPHMDHGGHLRRQGHHRHLSEKAGGLHAYDPPLPPEENRRCPHQVSLPLRPEHSGLPLLHTGAQGAGHRRHL